MEAIAYAALLLLIPVSVLAFATAKPHLAAAGILVFSVLFLPQRVAFDVPVLPRLDKQSVPALLALVGILATGGRRLRTARLGNGLDWAGAGIVLSALASALANSDPLTYGQTALPGLGLRNALSTALLVFLTVVAPYLIGRRCFQSSRDARELLMLMVLAAVVYIPFILFELRMSPQLHHMVYGFAQHSFGQTIRGGGYRPMVFMAHGLALALMVCTGLIAAWTLHKARARFWEVESLPVAGVLSVLLVLVKSFGSLVFGVVAVPSILLLRPRVQAVLLTVVCVIVFTFPVARATGHFPTQSIADLAALYSEDRAGSLQFRFDNEDLLLEKARERVWLGWGPGGRSRVFDRRGRDISVTDGYWIIVVGAFGTVGFVLQFGLLAGAVVWAVRVAAGLKEREATLLLGIAWIATIGVVDLLPNGLFSYLQFFHAGCLVGLAQGMKQEARNTSVKQKARARRKRAQAAKLRQPAVVARRLPAPREPGSEW